MKTPSTNADKQEGMERIPESMPQLQRLEQVFADFLKEYQLFINRYIQKEEERKKEGKEGNEPSFQELLEQLSNDQVTVTYRGHENMEGSFYFKDNKTGDEIRFRTAGTGGNHTYMKDSRGSEQLFLFDLNPAKGRNVLRTLSRIQDDKYVSLITDDGIDVVYKTEEDYQREIEASDRHCELQTQLKGARWNIFTVLFNRKKIKGLKDSLKDNPDPLDPVNFEHREKFQTRSTIPVSESEAIFERFNKIIIAVTASLREQQQ